MDPSLRRLLSNSPLCRGLTESELDEVLAIAEAKKVASGDIVFKQGEVADALFFIARGSVEVTKDGQVLARLGSGEVLGELSVFGSTYVRSADAKALVEVEALKLPTRDFRKLLDGWNVAALKVVSNLAHQLSERIVVLNEKLVAATKAKKADAGEARAALQNWKL